MTTQRREKAGKTLSFPTDHSKVLEPAILKPRKHKDDSDSCRQLRGSKLSAEVLTRVDPQDVAVVETWEQEALTALDGVSHKADTDQFKLMFDAAEYYESIGLNDKAIKTLNSIFRLSSNYPNPFMQRRAHSTLCVYYARKCDYKSSFEHAERAHTHSRMLNDPISMVATLCNTAVALDSCGLVANAREVARAASRIPASTKLLAHLQLLNANNALRYCHQLDDEETADYFYSVSRQHYHKSNRLFTNVTKAYHDAYTAEHLILKGNAGFAVSELEKAACKSRSNKNSQISAILDCALASGYYKLGDLKRLKICEQRLLRLLPDTGRLTSDQQDIVSVLVRVMQGRNDEFSERRRIKLRSRLQEDLVVSRHGHFFDAISPTLKNYESYVLGMQPPAFTNTALTKELSGNIPELNHSGYVGSWWASGESSERQIRTEKYDIAEDWAVAAEFYSGGDWQTCFGVGELVRTMALQRGMASSEATILGLAARLRDIGKIAVSKSSFEAEGWSLNDFGADCRHVEVGCALLSGSTDQILQTAKRVAAGHHEWWNGCGLPSGLKGEEIPIEARLCAVADTFFSLMQPVSGARWLMEAAAEQLASMAGVQLDPVLVGSLLQIVRATNEFEGVPGSNRDTHNKLLRSKKKLFECLELSE